MSESLVAAWQRVTHLLLTALEQELSDLGLSAGETNALAALADGRPRTVREVLDATGQRPSTLTGILDRLERAGLVERMPNPRDRRSVLLGLTADGARAAGRVAGAFAALEARLPERDVRRALTATEVALDA